MVRPRPRTESAGARVESWVESREAPVWCDRAPAQSPPGGSGLVRPCARTESAGARVESREARIESDRARAPSPLVPGSNPGRLELSQTRLELSQTVRPHRVRRGLGQIPGGSN